MSALSESHHAISLRKFLDLYLDVVEALSITTENAAKIERATGSTVDTMFSSPSLAKLLTSSPPEEVGKLFQFLIEVGQHNQALTNLTKLSPADKEALSRNLKQIVAKYRK